MLDKEVIYIVNKDLNIPDGKIRKPFYAQYKEMVKPNGKVYVRFKMVEYNGTRFVDTEDTFLVSKKKLNYFIDKCLTI